MQTLSSDFAAMQAGIERVSARIAGVPVADVLLLRMIKHLGTTLTARMERVLQPHGLAETDFSALMQLFSSADGGASPGELCGLIAQRPTNMTRITDALVRKRLVTRRSDAADRRRVALRITPAGVRFVHALLPQMIAELQSGFARLGARDKRQLDRLLRRLAASIDATGQDTPR
jgi:MarR family transcriptional repressor of emrRAB